jgi:adenosylcobinamide-GDP ribazoletransferase
MNDRIPKWMAGIDIQSIDIAAAFTLLTRLPIPVNHANAGKRGARAAWAYPLVGAALGLLAGVVSFALAAVGTPSGMAATAALGILMFTTGALHEDGLADCADGFGGGLTVARRLEIMKDSRIGAFGAAALVLAILARWSGYDTLIALDRILAFVAIGAASRLPMVIVMFAMPLARPTGLAASVGLVTAPTAILATGLTLAICILCVGLLALPVILIAILAALPLCALAWRRIEGYTGDVLGGCQQLAEIAVLATLIAFY